MKLKVLIIPTSSQWQSTKQLVTWYTSSIFFTMTYFPVYEAVATASSWSYVLLFFMLLYSSPNLHIKETWFIFFLFFTFEETTNKMKANKENTLETQGQLSRVNNLNTFVTQGISSTASPKAGKITTSPLSTTSNFFLPSSFGSSSPPFRPTAANIHLSLINKLTN